MKRGSAAVFLVLVLVLALVVGGFFIWQRSQVKAPATTSASTSEEATVKKVDLSTQPDWVQKLEVTARKGVSANGLNNIVIAVKGLPKGLVERVNYVLQYQTTNKGTQGALSTRPVDVSGATTFSKTIDLGTCSAKSCVRHEGVTSIDLELDFTTSSGEKLSWSKTLPL